MASTFSLSLSPLSLPPPPLSFSPLSLSLSCLSLFLSLSVCLSLSSSMLSHFSSYQNSPMKCSSFLSPKLTTNQLLYRILYPYAGLTIQLIQNEMLVVWTFFAKRDVSSTLIFLFFVLFPSFFLFFS